MGLLGPPFPRPSLSYCERDRSDEPVRIFYSAEPSVGSKGAIGCSNILSFGKPLEGLKAGNRRSNNRTIYVRMRLTIYLFIYLFNREAVKMARAIGLSRGVPWCGTLHTVRKRVVFQSILRTGFSTHTEGSRQEWFWVGQRARGGSSRTPVPRL